LTCSAVERRAALALAIALVAGWAGDAGAAQRRDRDPAIELTNPRLGPDYSQWLVGPIARLAAAAETDDYLALTDDAAAAAFIEEFWARRNPAPDRPGNPLREAFEQRAAEADKQFSEAGYRGRRTARGTTYVLFGPPSEVDHDIAPDPKDPPIELWKYKGGATTGLSGERPARLYRFIKRGDLTVFYFPTNRIGGTRIEDF